MTTIKLAYDLRWPDGRLHLQPAPLTDYRPVCQQSWSQGALLCGTRCFFPSGGQSHSQYSLLPTHEGMVPAESTWVPGSVPGGLPVNRSHPGSNWV